MYTSPPLLSYKYIIIMALRKKKKTGLKRKSYVETIFLKGAHVIGQLCKSYVYHRRIITNTILVVNDPVYYTFLYYCVEFECIVTNIPTNEIFVCKVKTKCYVIGNS